MDEAFRTMLQTKLDSYRDWARGRTFSGCRLVQYCGVQLAGAHDVPLTEAESRIEQLVCEGFYVDWASHQERLVLRVWEFGGSEPDWQKVLAEQPLADIDAILLRAGHVRQRNWDRMIQAMVVAAVFVGHVAAFTLAYYGRRQGVLVCQSDMIVFGVPFLLAVSAYTIPLGSLFRTRAAVSRIFLTGASAVCAALLSIVAGMTVAFNLMGT